MAWLTLKQLSEKFNIPPDRIEKDRNELLLCVDAHGRVAEREGWAYYHYYLGELGVELEHEDDRVRCALYNGRARAAEICGITLSSLHRRLQRVAKRDKTIAQLLPGKCGGSGSGCGQKWGIPL